MTSRAQYEPGVFKHFLDAGALVFGKQPKQSPNVKVGVEREINPQENDKDNGLFG